MLNVRFAAQTSLMVALGAIWAATATSAVADSHVAAGSDTRCKAKSAAEKLERANENVRVAWTEDEGGVAFEAVNLRPVAAEIIMSGRSSEEARDKSVVLPPFARVKLFEFQGKTREVARELIRANWRISSFMGDPAQISPDTDHRYLLPFKSGASYRLVQGFDGTISHQSEAARHALDFQLEVGDPVHAARDGVVVRAVDWFCRAGGPELIAQVNLIIIAHSDGTMAHYVHLDHRGLLVKEGDRVKRGQHIGFVGMTGFTGGPHLHFVVMRERDISIPIRFAGYEERDLSQPGRFRAP